MVAVRNLARFCFFTFYSVGYPSVAAHFDSIQFARVSLSPSTFSTVPFQSYIYVSTPKLKCNMTIFNC